MRQRIKLRTLLALLPAARNARRSTTLPPPVSEVAPPSTVLGLRQEGYPNKQAAAHPGRRTVSRDELPPIYGDCALALAMTTGAFGTAA